MAKRKQQLYDERRQQILNGALEVFSTKGFTAATNKDVADAAGISSPGLIYHYFDSKEDLLRAVIEHFAPPMQLVSHADEFMALPLEEALTQFADTYLRLMDNARIGACMRVIIGEAVHSQQFAEVFREIGPARIWQLLVDYLQRKMDEGTLAPANPSIAARCFAGPLVSYVLMRTILRWPEDSGVDTGSLISTSVSIFLRGLEAR